MQMIETRDARLHVSDNGPRTGRAVMFANSLGTDLRVWDGLVARLPQGLRIVRYDKRGHGLSDVTPAPYAIDTLVDDAEAVAEALGLGEVTFVGLSIGGLIGQGLAARRPDLVRALVLMDTAARIGTPEMWQERIAALRAGGIAGISDAILERWFAPAFRARPEFALWRAMLERTPLEGYIGCCAAIAGADLRAATGALSLPVLAMAGAEDGSTPPALLQETARLCGAHFEVIADAGHLPCVEQPEIVARLITDFFERTST